MKKEIFIIVFVIILLMQVVSAVELSLSKNEYTPRETLQGIIKGNFFSLKPENILIYKEDKLHSEPVISGLTKQQGIYYFYAILPNEEGNYSLRIENSNYISSGNMISDTILKNFTLKKSNYSALSIYPGFVFTNKDFSVKIKSLNTEQKISITLDATGEKSNFNLLEEDEKIITFSISSINSTNTNLRINDYNIPIFLVKKQDSDNQTDLISLIGVSERNITALVLPGKNYFFSFFIQNIGQKNLTNITISNDFNASIFPKKILLFNVLDSEQINFTIGISAQQKNNISGNIFIDFDDKSLVLPVFLELTTNKSKPIANSTDLLSCKNIGNSCTEKQECKGKIAPSLEGACCIGECTDKKSSFGNSWIFGIILLIVIIGLV